jgi:hypothetical protein
MPIHHVYLLHTAAWPAVPLNVIGTGAGMARGVFGDQAERRRSFISNGTRK